MSPRIVNVEQGTPEWLYARLGIPTASRFSEIMTPKTRKPSSSAKKYLCQLAAERLLGVPINDASSSFMQRGSELEGMAVSAYELERDCDTTECGFMLADSGKYGCSPDRLVGDTGMAEIKCTSAHVHVAALLGYQDDEHASQCQGQLLVSGRAWVDLVFYNPALPRRIVRIERDEDYIAALDSCLEDFCGRLEQAMVTLKQELGPAGLAALVGMEQGRSEGMEAHPATDFH